MSSDTDDEDLKQAIALSLQTRQGNLPDCPIDLDNVGEASPSTDLDRKTDLQQRPPTTQAPMQTGLSGLDRKQMESERLARLKRKRTPSSSASARVAHLMQLDSTTTLTSIQPSAAIPTPFIGTSNLTTGLRFPYGSIQRTAVSGRRKTAFDISFSEVLECSTLSLAVLSAFQWDMQWLHTKLTNPKTLITMVMQAKDEETKQNYRMDTDDNPRLRLCFPPMQGIAAMGCMHSKLMLLSHSEYLRIVVPTANLVPYDWGESGTMENMLFLIDLPRKASTRESSAESSDDKTPFFHELIHFLRAKGIEPSIVSSLSNFDFSNTSHLAFVHNIAGTQQFGPDDAFHPTGHFSLAEAVHKLQLSEETLVNDPKQGVHQADAIEIDYVTSSLGALKSDLLRTIRDACQGQNLSIPNTTRKGKTTTTKKDFFNSASSTTKYSAEDSEELHARIFFPTAATVTSSYAGSAGTICLSSSHYHSGAFPRHFLRSCINTRDPKVLMHNKLMLVRKALPPASSDTAERLSGDRHTKSTLTRELTGNEVAKNQIDQGWAYLGSANCTESAWGAAKLVQDRKTKKYKFNVRNWECGVVFRARFLYSGGLDDSHKTNNGRSTGKGQDDKDDEKTDGTKRVLDLPLPMELPGERYRKESGEQPWFFMG